MNQLKFLEDQNVSSGLIEAVRKFRKTYPVDEEVARRIVEPSIPFYGKDILEMAIAALLEGENLLLTGPKATGKNILAEIKKRALAGAELLVCPPRRERLPPCGGTVL